MLLLILMLKINPTERCQQLHRFMTDSAICGNPRRLDRVRHKILHRAKESVFGSRDMEGSVLCNGFERRSGLRRLINETLSIFGNTPWSHQTKRISALLLVVLAAVVAPGLSAQTYVPYAADCHNGVDNALFIVVVDFARPRGSR